MTDILKEIKQEDSERRINAILSKAAIGVFLLGCLVVAYLGFDSWNTNKKNERIEEDGVTLIQSVNKINYNKPKNASEDEKQKISDMNKVQLEKLEKLGEADRSGYSALANVYLASLALMDGNPSKAMYYYERLAKNERFSSTLSEYGILTAINATLQFSKGIYDSQSKKIHDYFRPYISDNEINEKKLIQNKAFSNAMALTGIAIEDETGKKENSNVYLAALKTYEGDNENVNFIIDMLSNYIAQKNEKENS